MKFTIATAVLATLLTASCRSKPHDHVVVTQQPASQPSVVYVEREHVHGTGCGHHLHNGVWYADAQHVTVVEYRR